MLSNPFILWGITVELILLGVIVYTPLGGLVLGTVPLPLWVWPPLVLGAIGLLLADELRKFVVMRLSNTRDHRAGFAQKEVTAHV